MSVSDLCRRRQWLVWKAAPIAAALAVVAGCTKDSPAAPTPTPPVVPEEIPPAPVARLAVSVDSRGSLVAISSLSEGTYTHPEGYTSPMAGELFGERELVLTIPAITFRSESGTGFNSDASRFTVMAHGGSASGLALTFSR